MPRRSVQQCLNCGYSNTLCGRVNGIKIGVPIVYGRTVSDRTRNNWGAFLRFRHRTVSLFFATERERKSEREFAKHSNDSCYYEIRSFTILETRNVVVSIVSLRVFMPKQMLTLYRVCFVSTYATRRTSIGLPTPVYHGPYVEWRCFENVSSSYRVTSAANRHHRHHNM